MNSKFVSLYLTILLLQIASFNAKVTPETIQGESGVCWTDVSENPKILIGEQVLLNVEYTLSFHGNARRAVSIGDIH